MLEQELFRFAGGVIFGHAPRPKRIATVRSRCRWSGEDVLSVYLPSFVLLSYLFPDMPYCVERDSSPGPLCVLKPWWIPPDGPWPGVVYASLSQRRVCSLVVTSELGKHQGQVLYSTAQAALGISTLSNLDLILPVSSSQSSFGTK